MKRTPISITFLFVVLCTLSCQDRIDTTYEPESKCKEIETEFCDLATMELNETVGPTVSTLQFILKSKKEVALSMSPAINVTYGAGLKLPPHVTEIKNVAVECIPMQHHPDGKENEPYLDYDLAVTATVVTSFDKGKFTSNQEASYRFSGLGQGEIEKITKVEACWAQ